MIPQSRARLWREGLPLLGRGARLFCRMWAAVWVATATGLALAPRATASTLDVVIGWAGLADSHHIPIVAYRYYVPEQQGSLVDGVLSMIGVPDLAISSFFVTMEFGLYVLFGLFVMWVFKIALSKFWIALFAGVFDLLGAAMTHMVVNQRIGYLCSFAGFVAGVSMILFRQGMRGRQLVALSFVVGVFAVPLLASQTQSGEISPTNIVSAAESLGENAAADLMGRGKPDSPAYARAVEESKRVGNTLPQKPSPIQAVQEMLADHLMRHPAQVMVYGQVLDDISPACAKAWDDGQWDAAKKAQPPMARQKSLIQQFCGDKAAAYGEMFSALSAVTVLAFLVAMFFVLRPVWSFAVNTIGSVMYFFLDLSVLPLPLALSAMGGVALNYLKEFLKMMAGALLGIVFNLIGIGLVAVMVSVGMGIRVEQLAPLARLVFVKLVITAILVHFVRKRIARYMELYEKTNGPGGSGHRNHHTGAKLAAAGAAGFAARAMMPVTNQNVNSRLQRALGGRGSGADVAQSALSAAGPWGRAAALGMAIARSRGGKAEGGRGGSWGSSIPRPAGTPPRTQSGGQSPTSPQSPSGTPPSSTSSPGSSHGGADTARRERSRTLRGGIGSPPKAGDTPAARRENRPPSGPPPQSGPPKGR